MQIRRSVRRNGRHVRKRRQIRRLTTVQKELSSKTMDKIAPVLTSLLPKVVNPMNEETDEFKQLPLLMKTQLRAALTELQALKTIASDCLSGIRRDVEFDAEYVKTATTKAQQLLQTHAKAGK